MNDILEMSSTETEELTINYQVITFQEEPRSSSFFFRTSEGIVFACRIDEIRLDSEAGEDGKVPMHVVYNSFLIENPSDNDQETVEFIVRNVLHQFLNNLCGGVSWKRQIDQSSTKMLEMIPAIEEPAAVLSTESDMDEWVQNLDPETQHAV